MENDEMNGLDTHLVAEYLRTIAELIRASQLTGAKAAELIDAKADALDRASNKNRVSTGVAIGNPDHPNEKAPFAEKTASGAFVIFAGQNSVPVHRQSAG